jgi:hypothetical protein
MSMTWKYICQLLIAILEELLAIPPGENHQPTAAAGLALVRKLTKEVSS